LALSFYGAERFGMPVKSSRKEMTRLRESPRGLLVDRLLNLQIVAIAIFVLCALVRLGFAYRRVVIPFELDYEEGNILNAGLRILNGTTPYPTPGTFPYILNPYGPIGYLFAAIGVKVFGTSLLGPRLLVLLAGICITACVALLARRFGARWDIASLCAVSFLASPIMWHWFPLLRVDLWAILFSMLGMCVFCLKTEEWKLSAVLFGFAVLTKHTAIAAPVACVLQLCAEKKPYKALGLAAISSGTVLLTLSFLPRPNSVLFHLLKTHPDPYELKGLMLKYLFMVGWSFPAVFVISYAVMRNFRPVKGATLPWLYFALSSAVSFTLGKAGSNTNHSLEWTCAAWLMAAMALTHLVTTNDVIFKPAFIAITLAAIALAFSPGQQFLASARQVDCPQAYQFVKSFGATRILSEDVSAVALSGKAVLVSNPFVLTELGNSVKWSEGSVEQLLQDRYFDLIILGDDPFARDRWSDSVRSEIARHYQPVRQFQCSPYSVSAFVPR
jgi:hypothetical protein